MIGFMEGFADELTKSAGVAKGVFKVVKKHPIRSLIAASIVGGTASAAANAHSSGLRGGEKGRYLQATRSNPGRAALTNYHGLFKHRPSKKSIRRVSKNHKSSTFSGYSSRPSKKESK